MDSTYFVGAILVWILFHSNHPVTYSQNISVSSRYHNIFTGKRLPPSPRNSHDRILDDNTNNLIAHHAGAQAYNQYTSVLASLSVYSVPLKANQRSVATVSLSIGNDGPQEQIEALQFGWHVDPTQYGDNDTHFFILWTKDGFLSGGCLNLECEGFIFNNQSRYRPGNKLKPVSERNGKQYYLTARIAKEPTGWYLYEGSGWNRPIGYWPVEIFNKLWEYGTLVVVGGTVEFAKGEPAPPMGSGFRPSDPKGKAAFIRVLCKKGRGDDVPFIGGLFADRKDCYSIARSNADYYFGGPAGCY